VTEGTVADTIVLPYNDVAAVDAAFDAHGAQIAAVIVEPIAANMGLVAPVDGYLTSLRERCTRHGALLVLDEVITGFRVGLGGAQQLFAVDPDISMFGKVIGGGLPLAAVGGRSDVMAHLAPLGPVYQAGTLSGNPLATAAGLAVLVELSETSYARLERRAERLADGFTKAFADAGVAAQVTRAATLVGVSFANAPVHDYESAQRADHDRYARFFHGMLDDHAINLAPSGYEAIFPSLAHTDELVDRTVDAAADVAARLAY
jgi:glutamate-1-semialdehyde 2,1-aminomutase